MALTLSPQVVPSIELPPAEFCDLPAEILEIIIQEATRDGFERLDPSVHQGENG